MRTKPRPAIEKAVTDFAEVKRRFIRQNRELAKNNSVQSLKIRGLESEVSRLLAQNVELREENLRLEHRLEKGEGKQNGGVMRELKRKLEELNGLVQGLQENDEEEYVRETMEVERVLSPSRQQYRERQPLAELMRDSQMPTIDEGKHFPRQTLDANEIRAMRVSDGSAATGSPDLGPPPVARFECEEGKNENVEEELLPSVNLETRRKRKDGHHPSEREIRRSSILALSPVKLDVEPAATSMLRTGAKRKLADRDADRTNKKDDFAFTRKPMVEQQNENEIQETVTERPASQPSEAPKSPAKPARKVLGDKSTNMSPRKTAPAAKPTKPQKEDSVKPKAAPRSQSTVRPPSRGRRTSSAPQLSEQPPAVASIELPPAEASLPPETPAPPLEDPFSPSTASASQSATAPMNRDTPPPSDLSSLSNTTTDARPSRRARSSVNYAEPSLVAKMRRPGKGMVDAISGLPAARRSSVDSTRKEVVIKVEPVDDEEESWAAKGSPLREKSTTSTSSTSSEPSLADDKIAVAQPKRRESLTVAESRKKREAIRTSSNPATKSPDTVEKTAEKLAEMDLYDFKDDEQSSSSPAAATMANVVVGKGRRHSSVLKDVGGVKMVGGTAGKSDVSKVTAAGRRRSMMV